MNTIFSAIKTFLDDENGVTAIEYGLIAALIAAAVATAATAMGVSLSSAFTYIKGAIDTAVPGAAPA